MNTTLEDIKKNHYNNYRNAIIETVNNNTLILVNEDIMSLLKKPPLESMDLIKNKFLDLSKKNKIILDISILNKIVDNYRNDSFKICKILIENRQSTLLKKIKDTSEYELIKFSKKDFNTINKNIRKIIKENLSNYIEKDIINNINDVFIKETNEETKIKINKDLKKYLTGNFIKQLIENIDFKILVKDSILISGIKEQNERYVFTLSNSHIFDVIE